MHEGITACLIRCVFSESLAVTLCAGWLCSYMNGFKKYPLTFIDRIAECNGTYSGRAGAGVPVDQAS